MVDPLEIKIKLYDHLREEILQAINTQHRTFIAESFFVSIVFSFGLIGTIILRPENGSLTYVNVICIVLLFIIAPGVIFFTSLWLIEQSRMMRAGDFLELLENDINSQLRGTHLIWENWLRRPSVKFIDWLRSPSVKFLDVHRLHHYAQYIIILMLLFIGYLSIGIIWIIRGEIPDELKVIALIIIVFYSILLLFLSVIFFMAVRHRTDQATIDEFKKFKVTYYGKIQDK